MTDQGEALDFLRRLAIATYRPRLRVRRCRRIVATVGAAGLALGVPSSADGRLTATVSRIHLRLFRRRLRQVALRMARLLDGTSAYEARIDDARAYWLQRVEERWGRARGLGPRPWRPTTTLSGLDRLEEALQKGRGAILWRVSSIARVPVALALGQAGYPLVHLSQPNHLVYGSGWASTRVASPIMRRAEERLILVRVEIPQSGSLEYLRELKSRLAENRVVSIVGDLSHARVTRSVTICHESRRLATGGASLAYSTGAALLPCGVRRTAPLSYRVEIEEPIRLDRSAAKNAAVAAAVDEMARRISARLAADPAGWPHWRNAP